MTAPVPSQGAPNHANTQIDLDALQERNAMATNWEGQISVEDVDALIVELRASRKLVALGSTLANRVIVRANIQGASKVRLLYEEERAAEAFEKALADLDGDHSRD